MAVLFLLLWRVTLSQSNPFLDRLNVSLWHRAEGCMKTISGDTRESMLGNMCPHLSDSRNLCKKENYLYMRMLYAHWEQKNYCPVEATDDYYQLSVTRLTKYSDMVHNVTQLWRPLFDSKADSILNSHTSHSVCRLAASKWRLLSNADFFRKDFRPGAVKCLNHLAAVRRGFHCALCDSESSQYMNNTQPGFWGRRTWRPRNLTSITFTHQTCVGFHLACLSFLDLKVRITEMVNVQYTLALCDSDGIYFPPYRSWESYKRLSPSYTYEFKARLQSCRKHLGHIAPEDGNSDRISDPVLRNKTESDCIALCEYEFSLSPMIFEDLINSNRVTAIYDMVNLMLNTNPLTRSMFLTVTTPGLNGVDIDFSSVQTTFFNFSRSNTTWGLSLLDHIKYTGFKKFDVGKIIKQAGIVGQRIALLIFVLYLLY